jgi:hypothetical protein
MAQKSRLKTMRALSVLLALAVAGLITAGAVQLRRSNLLTGAELIGWAFVPLALLLGFTCPVKCRVKTNRRKACGNYAYGLLFGCSKAAGHWKEKLLIRVGLARGEVRPVERRRPDGAQVFMHTAVQQSQPIRVTIEDSVKSTCAFWATIVSMAAGIIQVVAIFVFR